MLPVAPAATLTVMLKLPDAPGLSVPMGHEIVPAPPTAGVVQPVMPDTDANVVLGGVTWSMCVPSAAVVPPFAYRYV